MYIFESRVCHGGIDSEHKVLWIFLAGPLFEFITALLIFFHLYLSEAILEFSLINVFLIFIFSVSVASAIVNLISNGKGCDGDYVKNSLENIFKK